MKNSIFIAKIFFALLLTNLMYGQDKLTDIPRCKVTSNFSISELDCDTFRFTSLITSGVGTNVVGYTWDFGDGTTVGNQSPVNHSYSSNGTYTVKLSVYGSYLNGNGTQSLCKDTKEIQLVVNCPSTDCGVINNFLDLNNYCDDEVVYIAHLSGQITLNPGWTITQYKWTHMMSGGSTIIAYGSPSTVSMPCDDGFSTDSTLEVTATNGSGETCVITKSKPLLSGGSQYINGQCCLRTASVDIFPNPVSEKLIISTNFPESESKNKGSLQFELYDTNGILIKNSFVNIEESINQLDVSHLTNGIYFLKVIKDGNIIETKRIVKK